MSHPAVIRCAIGTEKPTHPRNLSWYADSAHCMNCSSSSNPEPSMITCTSSFIMSAMESRIKSGPFCQSKRPMNPRRGTSSLTSKPISRCSARLHSIFPDKSDTSKGASMCSSAEGFHSSMSMPFTTPSSRCTRVSSIASRPLPPSGVMISLAYPSLTVNTRSLVAIAPLRMFTTKPRSSSCARMCSGNWYSKQEYHSPGTPRLPNVTCGSTPWCRMLWIAAMVRAFLYVPYGRYLDATNSGTSPACQSFATNTTSSPYVPVNPFADAPSPKSITSGASHAACDNSVKRNWLSPYPPSASPYSSPMRSYESCLTNTKSTPSFTWCMYPTSCKPPKHSSILFEHVSNAPWNSVSSFLPVW
mmetsp:Transcript_6337/g.25665  ORF Transcript_6337/g.25665 Transcript_6337/m.25665 type:complete len:359 (-) Transcript_6337:627-1703(-)